MPELSLEQRRAQSALELVNAIKGGVENKRSYLEGLPAAFMVNGVMVTMLKCKADEEEAIHAGISNWLRQRFGLGGGPVEEALVTTDTATYRQITLEAMRYAEWLKRWAKAYMEKGKA